MDKGMIRVTLKGWRSPEQHPSESCLPEHLYYSSNFESVKLIKLVQDTGYNLAESKKAIDDVMDGHDFIVAFAESKLAQEFERKAKKYGAEVEI